MSVALLHDRKNRQLPHGVMKANVFRAPGHFGLEEKVIPKAGPGEACGCSSEGTAPLIRRSVAGH